MISDVRTLNVVHHYNIYSYYVVQSFDEQLEVPSPIDRGYAGYLAGSHDPTSHHVSVDSKQLEFDNQHCENKVSIL